MLILPIKTGYLAIDKNTKTLTNAERERVLYAQIDILVIYKEIIMGEISKFATGRKCIDCPFSEVEDGRCLPLRGLVKLAGMELVTADDVWAGHVVNVLKGDADPSWHAGTLGDDLQPETPEEIFRGAVAGCGGPTADLRFPEYIIPPFDDNEELHQAWAAVCHAEQMVGTEDEQLDRIKKLLKVVEVLGKEQPGLALDYLGQINERIKDLKARYAFTLDREY